MVKKSNLVGHVNGETFIEGTNDSVCVTFLQKLEELMKEYKIQKIDIAWKKEWK